MSSQDHLHRNELEHLGQSMGKWFEKYGMVLLGGVCGLIVVSAIVYYVIRSGRDATEKGWAELRTALITANETNSPEGLLGIADHATHKNTVIGTWARLYSAELRLSNALHAQFVDRDSSKGELAQARSDFDAVLKNGNTTDEIRERALYGLATVQEATAAGADELAAALKAYETLIEDFPETEFKTIVERRIAELKKPEAGEFYAFFAAQKPTEVDDRAEPEDGGGSSLEIPEDLLLRPDAGDPMDGDPADPEDAQPGPALGTPNGASDDSGDDAKDADDSADE